MAPFGLNKLVANENNFQEDGDDRYQLCYKIFDILYLKMDEDSEEIIMFTKSLKERK
jgi:hypothetical protein